MRELWSRLRTAWYVLRGQAVIRAVDIDMGKVTVHRRRLDISGPSSITRCDISMPGPGPVLFTGDGIWVDNEGDIANPPPRDIVP